MDDGEEHLTENRRNVYSKNSFQHRRLISDFNIQTQKTDEFNESNGVIDFDQETNLVPFGEEYEGQQAEILALIAPAPAPKPLQGPRSPQTRKLEKTIENLYQIVREKDNKIEEWSELANNMSYQQQLTEKHCARWFKISKESAKEIEQLKAKLQQHVINEKEHKNDDNDASLNVDADLDDVKSESNESEQGYLGEDESLDTISTPSFTRNNNDNKNTTHVSIRFAHRTKTRSSSGLYEDFLTHGQQEEHYNQTIYPRLKKSRQMQRSQHSLHHYREADEQQQQSQFSKKFSRNAYNRCSSFAISPSSTKKNQQQRPLRQYQKQRNQSSSTAMLRASTTSVNNPTRVEAGTGTASQVFRKPPRPSARPTAFLAAKSKSPQNQIKRQNRSHAAMVVSSRSQLELQQQQRERQKQQDLQLFSPLSPILRKNDKKARRRNNNSMQRANRGETDFNPAMRVRHLAKLDDSDYGQILTMSPRAGMRQSTTATTSNASHKLSSTSSWNPLRSVMKLFQGGKSNKSVEVKEVETGTPKKKSVNRLQNSLMMPQNSFY